MHVVIQRDRATAPVAPPAPPALIDNPLAPELFATAVSGFSNVGGVIILTLESARCDHSGPAPLVGRVVVGRVALSVPAAQALVTGLNEFLEAQNLSPSRAIVGDSTRQ